MKRLVIFNVRARGAGDPQKLRRSFAFADDCEFCATTDGSDVKHQVQTAIKRGTERIIVAGGDGSISSVVDALADDFSQVDLAILPLGTGNDLARSLGIPIGNLDAACKLALSKPSVPIDVVRVFDGKATFLINAASAGFGGQVAANIADVDKARWGAFAYWTRAVSELVNLPQFDIHIELDDRSIDTRAYGLTIANGRFLGGGFPIAREALVDDGMLDVTVIPVLPTLELLAAGLNYMVGVASGGDRLLNYRAERVHVTSKPDMLFSIDGDPIREIDTTFEVLPKALRVVAGQDAPGLVSTSPAATSVLPNELAPSLPIRPQR